MNSRAAPRFWAAYRELPPEVKQAARRAYRLFHEMVWFWIGNHAGYERLLQDL